MNRILIFGATSAIAQEVARNLAKEGASFFLVARSAVALGDISADLTVRGAASVMTRVADLAVLDTLADLCDEGRDALGGIDVAVIAHGILPDQKACENSVDATLGALRVNAMSPAALMTRLGEIIGHQGSGSLVVISSVAGDRGRPSNYVYGASKALLSVMGEGMALALGSKGVNVLVVKPGFVDTPMTAAFPKGPLWASAKSVGDGIVEAVRKGRRGVIYAPFWWRFIMLVIRFAPGFVVSKI
ncbi:SDR family NAD(P)-dependent oxidoreductase [Parvibaculum sp.]|uniref:SDR family NAD(P)-dependent oxidoreductase n=1 Tax=Parvibaculum sp. TaxID=2024848 RepID=UPI00320FDC3B